MTMPAPKPDVVPVPSAAPLAGKFNNVDSQIGIQAGGPQQILSQTISTTGVVDQKPVVGPTLL